MVNITGLWYWMQIDGMFDDGFEFWWYFVCFCLYNYSGWHDFPSVSVARTPDMTSRLSAPPTTAGRVSNAWPWRSRWWRCCRPRCLAALAVLPSEPPDALLSSSPLRGCRRWWRCCSERHWCHSAAWEKSVKMLGSWNLQMTSDASSWCLLWLSGW